MIGADLLAKRVDFGALGDDTLGLISEAGSSLGVVESDISVWANELADAGTACAKEAGGDGARPIEGASSDITREFFTHAERPSSNSTRRLPVRTAATVPMRSPSFVGTRTREPNGGVFESVFTTVGSAFLRGPSFHRIILGPWRARWRLLVSRGARPRRPRRCRPLLQRQGDVRSAACLIVARMSLRTDPKIHFVRVGLRTLLISGARCEISTAPISLRISAASIGTGPSGRSR